MIPKSRSQGCFDDQQASASGVVGRLAMARARLRRNIEKTRAQFSQEGVIERISFLVQQLSTFSEGKGESRVYFTSYGARRHPAHASRKSATSSTTRQQIAAMLFLSGLIFSAPIPESREQHRQAAARAISPSRMGGRPYGVSTDPQPQPNRTKKNMQRGR